MSIRENTIKAHADILKQNQPEKYNKMMAELTLVGQQQYFYQTLCIGKDYDLRNVRSVVRDIMCEYLGFTPRNFRENVLPELPEVPKLEAA